MKPLKFILEYIDGIIKEYGYGYEINEEDGYDILYEKFQGKTRNVEIFHRDILADIITDELNGYLFMY